jgi:hypothetical protein
VPDGVSAQEKNGSLEVLDATGNVVKTFQNVQQWYVGEARPGKG